MMLKNQWRLLCIALSLLLVSVWGSITYDLNTGEDITTFNGQVPATSCPKGFYRPQGSTNLLRETGQRQDGCVKCPRGRYGSSTGMELLTCTGPCPLGKYGPLLGMTSANDCVDCPRDTYSSQAGIISDSECLKCPVGKYTVGETGKTNAGQCKKCPFGYPGHQCTAPALTRAPIPSADKTMMEDGIKNGDYARKRR